MDDRNAAFDDLAIQPFENMSANIKGFKIMANKYRNRSNRHSLCLNLICGMINFGNL